MPDGNSLERAIDALHKVADSDKVFLKRRMKLPNGQWEERQIPYTKVVTRVEILRRFFGIDANVVTTVLHHDPQRVLVRAEIWVGDHPRASGHAEEWRGGNKINEQNAIENAETSAIGRALAAFGLGGEEFASAEEMRNVDLESAGGPLPVMPPAPGGGTIPSQINPPPPATPPAPPPGDHVGSEFGLPPPAQTNFDSAPAVFDVPKPTARNSWEDMAWTFHQELQILPTLDQLAGWYATHAAQLRQMQAARPAYYEQLERAYAARKAQMERPQ